MTLVGLKEWSECMLGFALNHRLPLLALLAFCSTAFCASSDIPFKKVQPVLKENCYHCHGGVKMVNGTLKQTIKGKVNLADIKDTEDFLNDPKLLEKMIEALQYHDMPPEDEEQPTEKVRDQLVTALQSMLKTSIAAGGSIPRTPIRRMNRFQYNNAVVDLFELKHDIFALPERMMRGYGYFDPASGKMPDVVKVGSRPLGKSQLIAKRFKGVSPFPQDLRAEHGFDNRADHLTMSPILMESFIKLSLSILHNEDFGPKQCGIWDSFFKEPLPEVEVKKEMSDRLNVFLTTAFRRPVEESVLKRYVDHTYSLYQSETSFTDCMKSAASATLGSPRFLYLYESHTRGNKPQPLDDFELASRLSFFLWGSIPDAELHELAAAGKLKETDVLKAQVGRMLKDKKTKRFCDTFPAQWLQLERIISSVPNPDRYGHFYAGGGEFRFSAHMTLEPLLLFETILIEDRSILELIDSDYSYRSDNLNTWYRTNAKPQKKGQFQVATVSFKRVPIDNRREGGVITTAAVMTMTSSPTRSQPISRGAWLAAVIFNNPPEPPPADVPPLKENESGDVELDGMTIREKLVAHQTKASCISCHAKIDPLGFALENYGPVGNWRDVYRDGQAVDASGKLFKQHPFTTIEDFKDAILKEKDLFLHGFASHLLSFSLGRQVSTADRSALDTIVKQTSEADYRMKSLIEQIVLSDPFRQKYNPVGSVATIK